jgi:hypothetical protein
MPEKKWRKTDDGINVKKRYEYLSNLPSQKRLDSGGSCAFWGVRTWKRLFLGVSGVGFLLPFLKLTLPPHPPPNHPLANNSLQTSYSMARTKV